jgi:hypothetical protein
MKFDDWYNLGWILAMRLAALGLGLYLTYCEVTGTRDYYLAVEHDNYTWIVKAMIGITLATAVTPTVITMAIRARQWALALGFLVMLPVAILIVFAAAVSRTGASADMQHQAVQQAARNANLDTTVEQEAYKALAEAKKRTKGECADGRGGNCKALEQQQADAQKRWDDAVKAIKGETVSIADPWFSRAAALSKGLVTEDDMRTYWPALPPIIVSVFAGLLIAFGAHLKTTPGHAPQPIPERAPRVAPRERETWRLTWRGKKRGLVPQPAHPSIAPERAPEIIEAEIVEPERRPSPFRRKVPGLKLVASNADMSALAIVDFIVETMESCPGGRVAEPDVYKAYMRNCKAASAKPLSASEFVPVLDKVCTDLGIRREQKGNRVYLVDVQLVRAALAS